jgi:hypothetical protein
MMSRKKTMVSTVVGWHRPLCTYCNEPILEMCQGLAGFIEGADIGDSGRVSGDPFICHSGSRCGFYSRFEGHANIQDLSIEMFRRSPMEAAIMALRHNDGSEASVLAWTEWLSVVIGMPFNAWNCVSALVMRDERADSIPTRALGLDAWKRIESENERTR